MSWTNIIKTDKRETKMSIDKFLGLDKRNIGKEHLYIQLIGGHGSGKSSIVGELKRKYGKKVCVLGRYSESKTNNKYLTGGTDMFKMTTPQRFDYITQYFRSTNQIVIAEGMFITWYQSFLSRYHELQKLKQRNIYIILLTCETDVLCDRIYKRSKGKPITDKRLENITGKAKTAESAFNKLTENDTFKKIKVDNTNPEDLNKIIEIISNIIDEVL